MACSTARVAWRCLAWRSIHPRLPVQLARSLHRQRAPADREPGGQKKKREEEQGETRTVPHPRVRVHVRVRAVAKPWCVLAVDRDKFVCRVDDVFRLRFELDPLRGRRDIKKEFDGLG